ncbi:MAG: hypothetical protein J6S67_23700 [Methanobrevibacter sp.]|nr:hypothetical protein [Methanobrevibacter sp.]
MKISTVIFSYVGTELVITGLFGRDIAMLLFIATMVGVIIAKLAINLSTRKEDE